MASLHAITTTEKAQWKKNTTLRQGGTGEADLVITERTEQEWKGFGGCFNELGWRALSHLSAKDRDAVIKDLVDPDGCNFNFCRMPIGANDYSEDWYSHNENDGDFAMKKHTIARDREQLIPYIKAAKKHRADLELFASPWSPPTWMKFPRAHNYGTFIWKKEYLNAYALYFKKFVEAYAAEGLKISQVHVQNEPVSSQKFPSCVWTGEQLRVFIRDYLGPLFAKNKIDVDIWLGTLNGPETDGRASHTRYNDYANIVLDDNAARKFIKGVSYQWAGKYAIQRTHAAWPEMQLMQSENECGNGGNSWAYSEHIFDLFYHYLTNGAQYYIYWNMVLETRGESTWGWNQNSMLLVDPKTGTLQHNPEYYLMKHFSKFIQPGDRRIVLEKRWSGNAVAFGNRKNLTVVAHNPFDTVRKIQLDGQVSCNVTLPPKSFSTLVIPR